MTSSNYLDLGHNHLLHYFEWAPDRDIQSNADLYAGVADVPKAGVTIRHLNVKTGAPCMSACWFDTPSTREIPGLGNGHRWQVESWEPLTLSPSIRCQCGDHGYVKNGKWERAT